MWLELKLNMRNLLIYSLLTAVFYSSCNSNMGQDHKYTNKLIDETSPYLLQHAHNPVNWQPWGSDALEQAKKENKLIIISIGYAACHWCHVMEHESFEDSTIAATMNKYFVSIKVDREERPDIDQIYMDAAQLMTGRGGWPLNVIALPDGRPIHAETYLPRNSWEKLLVYFSDILEKESDKVYQQAERITEGIAQHEMPVFNENTKNYSQDSLNKIGQNMVDNIDMIFGGRQGAPKFPMPSVYESMLTQNYFLENDSISQAIQLTLGQMADGGIYDHLGGGFARYSTDDRWIVPHFEKMLYDNAQLISLYSHAYQVYRNEKYAQAIRETIEFCNRELSDDNGGFYSSLDADSEGEEGKFYVWTLEEVKNILKEDADLFIAYYGMSKKGNFEEKNILVRQPDLTDIVKEFSLSEIDIKNKIEDSKKKLMLVRDQRIRPGLDDKILTSWNGLMISGLVDAYFSLGDDYYLERALKTGNFLLENQINDEGQILRNHKDGRSTINGFLDDYAYTILAFVKLYEGTFDEKWLYQAQTIKEYVDVHFGDDKSKMYFYTADNDEKLIARKMELSDNVIPASNSAMAHALFQLGQYFYNEEDIERAAQMVANSEENFMTYPHYYSNWTRLYTLMGNKHFEVAIVGADADDKKRELAKDYKPNKILLGGKDEGTLELLKGKLASDKTYVYVCTNKACQLPVTEVGKAIKQITK